MQFKYPEILWGLCLLVIPVLIHLFQLRRFKKTPFTNVKFLKLVVSESRKSSTLKKWLLLLTRLLLITALVLAFAQPFTANSVALKEKQTIFYLDNSFSLGYTANGSTFFQSILQEFIQTIPKEKTFSLFTNNKTYKEVSITDIQNELLNTSLTSDQLTIQQIKLKAATLFSNQENIQKNLVVISDFQKKLGIVELDTLEAFTTQYVQPRSTTVNNISIDSVYVANDNVETIDVAVVLSSNAPTENVPVSLFNSDTLIAKAAAKFDKTQKASVQFTISAKEPISGKLSLIDNGLTYDNHFYFNIENKPKIKVLHIGNTNNSFLKRIYTEDEFAYKSTQLKNLNYSDIENNHLVILDELPTLPSALQTSLSIFIENGGSLALIPAPEANLVSYNVLSSTYANTTFIEPIKQQVPISEVQTAHPLFKNVFDQTVHNFQYPTVNTYYKVNSNAPVALSYQNKEAFLVGNKQVYIFSASLGTDNSNFKNAPLIVPTFYNMGLHSLQLPALYTLVGNETTTELPILLQQDEIIKAVNNAQEFIPMQRVLAKKVALSFGENPKNDGIYTLTKASEKIGKLSFNYNRSESELVYSELPNNNTFTSINSFFEAYQNNNTINEFWKWFVILALLFAIVETLLQKFIT